MEFLFPNWTLMDNEFILAIVQIDKHTRIKFGGIGLVMLLGLTKELNT